MTPDPILNADWFVVARSHDVGASPLSVVLFDRRIVIWRSGNLIAALDDLCVHRGASLSKGKIVDDCIQCPYHGWRYGVDGQCVLIPQQKERSIPARAKVGSVNVVERYGWVWISLSSSPNELPYFGDWASASCRHIHCGPYGLNTFAVRAIENFLDVTHLPFVHEGILGETTHTEIEDFDAVIGENGLVIDPVRVWQPNPDGRTQGSFVTYIYHAPRPCCAFFTKRFDGQSFKIMLVATPTEGKQSVIWIIITLDYESPLLDHDIRSFQDQIIAQDIPIVESQHPDRIPLELQSELHVKSDRATIAYRKWLSQLGVRYGVMEKVSEDGMRGGSL